MARIQELEHRNAKLETDCTAKDKALDTAQKEVARLNRELSVNKDDAKAKLSQLQAEHDALKSDFARLQSDHSLLKTAFATQSKTVTSLQADISKYVSDIAVLTNDVAAKATRIQALEAEFERINQAKVCTENLQFVAFSSDVKLTF